MMHVWDAGKAGRAGGLTALATARARVSRCLRIAWWRERLESWLPEAGESGLGTSAGPDGVGHQAELREITAAAGAF